MGAGPFLDVQPDRPGWSRRTRARRRLARARRSPGCAWRSSGCRARRPTRSSSGCRTSACSRAPSASRASATRTCTRSAATCPRPAAQWVRSLDVLRGFPARRPGQEPRPLGGRHRGVPRPPAQLPRRHRVDPRPDVRRMNQGYVPDQIVELVGEMPPHLRAYETTGLEGYGSVATRRRARSTPGTSASTPARSPTSTRRPYEHRQRGLRAGDGRRRPGSRSWPRTAMADDDDRWAIELLGYLVRSDPTDTEARELVARPRTAREGYRQGTTRPGATGTSAPPRSSPARSRS